MKASQTPTNRLKSNYNSSNRLKRITFRYQKSSLENFNSNGTKVKWATAFIKTRNSWMQTQKSIHLIRCSLFSTVKDEKNSLDRINLFVWLRVLIRRVYGGNTLFTIYFMRRNKTSNKSSHRNNQVTIHFPSIPSKLKRSFDVSVAYGTKKFNRNTIRCTALNWTIQQMHTKRLFFTEKLWLSLRFCSAVATALEMYKRKHFIIFLVMNTFVYIFRNAV